MNDNLARPTTIGEVIARITVTVGHEFLNTEPFGTREGGDIIVSDAESIGVDARKPSVFAARVVQGADAGAIAAIAAVVL